jgi:hypothetical protein
MTLKDSDQMMKLFIFHTHIQRGEGLYDTTKIAIR